MNHSDAPILYHNGSAVCAAKVRFVMAEKGVAYDSRPIDLTSGEQFAPDYLRLNPQGVVPTLVHDGRILVESTVIAEYVDDAFAGPALRPDDAYGRAQSHLWTRREDAIHGVINTVTTIAVFRPGLLARAPEDRAIQIAAIPDAGRRAKMVALLEHGIASPIVAEAMARLAAQVADMQEALQRGAWLLGEGFTLADAGLASFFYRLRMLGLGDMWRHRAPDVQRWFEAIEARPAFAAAIGAFITEPTREHYAKRGHAVASDLLRLYSEAAAQT